ncbi:WXG100 family type VII secretion target [Nocardia puris]|uniref:WXG100 family type VII secretion target n=2 Tax=Nocardia puris TaxID=208602 RepID=UPI0018958FBC|nr:WXG100 family type VII secretion target [Nocardia puris]MBF6213692.1 WXG100 family type VII secretion target [Nocardia puris]MBF6462930.1 WXG100 family type VII secretion target [Nocardia puris]
MTEGGTPSTQSLSVVPEKVRAVGNQVYALAEELKSALDSAGVDVDSVLDDGWTGSAANEFFAGWTGLLQGWVTTEVACREAGLRGCRSAQAVSERVPRRRRAGRSQPRRRSDLEQVAADFGVHPMTLSKWMRQAEIDDGNKPGTTRSESVELRDARRRIRLLEQENEVLRRAAAYLSQAQIPGKGSTRS